VLTGTLSTRADLLFSFSQISMLDHDTGTDRDFNVITLAADLRYVASDRVELGLTIPVLTLGYYFTGLTMAADEAAFGNLELKIKVKVWGSSSGPVIISLYTDGIMPTVSPYDPDLQLSSREFGGLRYGVAAASQLLGRLAVGGGTGQTWAIFGQGQPDIGTHQIDAWAVFYAHRVIALQLALQLDILHHYPGVVDDEVGLLLLPAAQLYPTPNLHIDLGARIAATDGGKRVTGGRAALLFALGYLF